jgi:hypothetical protein
VSLKRHEMSLIRIRALGYTTDMCGMCVGQAELVLLREEFLHLLLQGGNKVGHFTYLDYCSMSNISTHSY